jgi:hypothetical protein
MSVDKQWVRNVPLNDACFFDIYIIHIIYDPYAFALWRISWLQYPYILPLISFPLSQKVLLKISIIVWQNVCGREKVEIFLAELLLHPVDILAQPVFASDFLHPREDIDPLVLMKTLKGIIFTMLWGPQNVPFCHAFRLSEAIWIKDLMDKLVVAIKDLIKELRMV